MSDQGSGIQSLVQILNQVLRVFEADGEARHAASDAGFGELGVRVAPLRREDGEAAQAFDPPKAGGSLEQLQAIEEPLGANLPATEVHTDHPAKARHLLL